MTDSLAAGLRVAIYARVSSEEQREGQTIDSQIAELERFARDKGWPVIDTYRDDGWSGGVMERPQLDRLRDDGRNGRFAAVLLNDVDRLARDVTHLGIIKRDLERHDDVEPTTRHDDPVLPLQAQRRLTDSGRRAIIRLRHVTPGEPVATGLLELVDDRPQPRLGIRVLFCSHNKSLYATLRKRKRRPVRCKQEDGLKFRHRALELKDQEKRPRVRR
jgi:hypothetical protein